MGGTQEFDYIVIGDEPAGLWLLEQLEARHQKCSQECHSAWLQGAPNPAPVALCKGLAKDYAIQTSDAFHLEMVSRKEKLVWSRLHLKSRFPQLARWLFDPKVSAAGRREKAGKLLTHYPELLNYAEGFWKLLGRSHRLAPESLLLNAVNGTALGWWQPTQALTQNTTAIAGFSGDRAIDKIYFSNRGMVSIQLADESTLLTRSLILNTTLSQLNHLKGLVPELGSLLDLAEAHPAPSSLYPFRIKVKGEAIPQATPDLFLFYEDPLLPDPDHEIVAVQINRKDSHCELILWVSAPSDLCLDDFLLKVRQGMKSLNWLFPFLDTHLEGMSLALEMESCSLESARSEVLKHLGQVGRPHYALSRTRSQTRRSNLHFLSPSLHCHLPYPFGPLKEARELLQKLTRELRSPAPPKQRDDSAPSATA